MKPVSILVSFDAIHSLCFNYLEPVVGGAYLLCLDYSRVIDYELEVFLLGEQHRDMVGEDVTEAWLEGLCPIADIRRALKRDIRRTIQTTITRMLGADRIARHHYEYEQLTDPLEYRIVDRGDSRDVELEELRARNQQLEEMIKFMEG